MIDEKSEYEKKADDFLASTGTSMETEYLGYMKHFYDDNDKRNVWDITFTRGKRTMTVRFYNPQTGKLELA